MVDPWMIGYSGEKIPLLRLGPEHIDISDIARGLANQCRWGGQIHDFYSVAQHSVLLSQIVPDDLALFALFHDAHEAFLGDLPRPIKRGTSLGFEYSRVADHFQRVIEKKFGISGFDYDDIAPYDDALGIAEAKRLLTLDVSSEPGFLMEGKAAEVVINPWPPEMAYGAFLQTYKILLNKEKRRETKSA